MDVVYNLRMLRTVTILKNDLPGKKFEFSLLVQNEEHIYKVPTREDLDSWVQFIKKGISMARPLIIGPVTTNLRNPKKARESKVLDAQELMALRPRLSSGRSLQSHPSQGELQTPTTPAVPENSEAE